MKHQQIPKYELAKMMSRVPNFAPRRNGFHIYRKEKDTKAGKCIYCADRIKKQCKHKTCPYLIERAALGALNIAGVIADAFKHEVTEKKLKCRVKRLISNHDKHFFLSTEHEYRFNDCLKARKSHEVTTGKYYAALYLLTSTYKLWAMTKDNILSNQILFENIKMRNLTASEYACYQMARSFFHEVTGISSDEMSDKTIICDDTFKLIVHAKLLEKFGLGIKTLFSKNYGGIYNDNGFCSSQRT